MMESERDHQIEGMTLIGLYLIANNRRGLVHISFRAHRNVTLT
jgi:hypothetical protein